MSETERYEEACRVTMAIPFRAATHELEDVSHVYRGGFVAWCSCYWRSPETSRDLAEEWWADHVETERNREFDASESYDSFD